MLIEILQSSPILLAITLFVFGACVGSFLNVVTFRLPERILYEWKQHCVEALHEDDKYSICRNNDTVDVPPVTLISPKSYCPNCRNSLKWCHNIPIFGYFILNRKCYFCQIKIPTRYPIVEFFSGIICAYLGYSQNLDITLLFSVVFLFVLIVLSLIDSDHQLLPDNIVLPFLWLGLVANYFNIFTDLHSSVLGAILGYLSLWLLFQIHSKLTGKIGMGYGDFKLLAALGAWLGWQQLPSILLLASISGTIVTLYLIAKRKTTTNGQIAFGPYLAFAGSIVFLWGDSITALYSKYL